MSAINVNQAEASVLVDSLKMFAKVHETASGVVPEEVAALLSKLAPEPVAQPVVVEAAPVVAAPAEEQAEIDFADTDKPSEDE